MLFVFILLAITIALLLWDKLPMEIVALLSVLALVLSETVTVEEALAGFANSTVISITALFVVGAGLFHTGIADWAARRMIKIGGQSQTRFIVVLVLFAAVLSGFLSNTGTIAVLLPAVVSAANRMKVHPGKFLLPLAFSAQFGGLLTLVGTAPNIVIANQLRDAGMQPFSFFEFSLLGVPLLICYALYVGFFRNRMTPDREPAESQIGTSTSYLALTDAYKIQGKFFRLRVRRNSPLIGQTRSEAHITTKYGIHLLRIVHADAAQHDDAFKPTVQPVDPNDTIGLNDVLVVEGEDERIRNFAVTCKLAIQVISGKKKDGRSIFNQEIGLAEALITQRSNLVGTSIKDARFADRYGVNVVGVMRNGEPLPLPFNHTPLQFGDALLVFGRWRKLEHMRKQVRDFIVVGRPDESETDPTIDGRGIAAVAIMFAMIALLLTKAVPMVIAIMMAAVGMVLLGCLKTEDAYRSINWQSIILIAAMLPMSTALAKTGGAQYVADAMVAALGDAHPLIFLAGIFLLTSVFSQFISNTATTVLVAPIAMGTAQMLGLSPYPVMMMVAAGASSAFLTPIATPVNTLVLGPGNYRFADFAKGGIPVALLVMVVALILVPLIWPL
jgi:di/tricarboxylate transporter